MVKKWREGSVATAENELIKLRARETEIIALLEDARREHNGAVGSRHLATGFDEAAVAAIDDQIVALRSKFDEITERLADATAQREAAEQRLGQLVDNTDRAIASDFDQRIGAIQEAVASFQAVSDELAKKLADTSHAGANLSDSVFWTADVLEQRVHGLIGDLEAAKVEFLLGVRSLPNLNLTEPATPLVPSDAEHERAEESALRRGQ